MESDQPNHKIRVHCNNRFYVDIVHISYCLFSPCPCRFFYTRIISPCFKITIYSKKNFRKSSRQKHYPFWLLFQFHCTPRAVNYLIKSRSFGNSCWVPQPLDKITSATIKKLNRKFLFIKKYAPILSTKNVHPSHSLCLSFQKHFVPCHKCEYLC